MTKRWICMSIISLLLIFAFAPSGAYPIINSVLLTDMRPLYGNQPYHIFPPLFRYENLENVEIIPIQRIVSSDDHYL